MNVTRARLNELPVHFILCTERSGSSLLSLMLNLHPQIICPSEEPFAVFFYERYKKKISWTEKEIRILIDEFWLMSEKNLDLFFTTKEKLFSSLVSFKDNLPYDTLMKLIYLNFLEQKDKAKISLIVDKQIKYFFYLPELITIFPNAKFIILVRDVRDNIVSKTNRKLNSGSNPVYLSSLWKNTYNQIQVLKNHHKSLLIIKYEDLVTESASTLQKICDFVNIQFDPEMIKTEGKYEQFLNLKRSEVTTSEISRLENFQSNLFQAVNKSHIGTFTNHIDQITLSKIENQNKYLFHMFGYDLISNKLIKLNFADYFQLIRAWLYRPVLLRFYLHIPLKLKLIIKQIRK